MKGKRKRNSMKKIQKFNTMRIKKISKGGRGYQKGRRGRGYQRRGIREVS
jgi:hypothetical protein